MFSHEPTLLVRNPLHSGMRKRVNDDFGADAFPYNVPRVTAVNRFRYTVVCRGRKRTKYSLSE